MPQVMSELIGYIMSKQQGIQGKIMEEYGRIFEKYPKKQEEKKP